MVDARETLFAASLQVLSVRRFVSSDWAYGVEMYAPSSLLFLSAISAYWLKVRHY
jgi:hypothetical protein